MTSRLTNLAAAMAGKGIEGHSPQAFAFVCGPVVIDLLVCKLDILLGRFECRLAVDKDL